MDGSTIAAVASGMTASGIGIIRISGPEAFLILSRVFRPRRACDVTKYRAGTVHYGHIVNEEQVIDECLVTIFRAPHSYTAEDTAEINTHGGIYVMQRVLDTVLANGARAAEPGEFTKRAFLNGRIDLTEAEAVMDVIRARSDDALTSSLMQLSGSVRDEITKLRAVIMDELAYIEAAIDDPEHYELHDYGETLLAHLAPVTGRLRRLMASFGEGRRIREGILTVIIGKPNAGKSSLLNALTGEERAIVTEIEGTTRDILEEEVRLGGLLLRVIDTAGIREAADRVEEIGIGRAKEYAEKADLILALFDSASPFDDNDREILKLIAGRKTILVLNKSDLAPRLTADMLRRETAILPRGGPDGEEMEVVTISAKDGNGLPALEEAVRKLFFSGEIRLNEEAVLTNARHRQHVDRALASLSLVEQSVRDGMPEDFYSIDLMEAYASLGEIIGEGIGDDLADTIFAKFCMGK